MMAPHPAPAEALSTAPVVELFDNCSERLAECKWDPSIDDLASANFAPPWLSPAFVSATTCPIIVTFEDISGTWLPVYLAAQSVSLRLKGVDGMGWYAVRNTMDHEMVSRMDGAAVRHKKGSAGYHRALTRYSERFRYELPDAEPGWVIIGDGQSGMAGGAKNANDARGLEPASNNLSFMKDGTMVVNAPTTGCVPGLCPSSDEPFAVRMVHSEFHWNYGPEFTSWDAVESSESDSSESELDRESSDVFEDLDKDVS